MANTIGTLRTVFAADTRGLVMGAKQAQGAVKAFSGTVKSATKVMAGLGLAATAAGALIIGMSIKTGAQFERTMAVVRGVTRATGEEFLALTAIARKMGAETEWTANQAAEALKFLGMAGFEAGKAISALPSTLDLATAGNIDLGRSADIVTNALTAMQLPVEALNRVSDVFIGTITRTNTDMNMMAESFKFAAPVAKAFGYEIERLSSMIGNLGNAGVQGSMAGTQLAFAIQKSARVAKDFNMSGAGFVEVLKEMNRRGWEGGQVMKAFGMRGGRAALILRDMIPEIERLEQTLKNAAGETKALADIMRDTVSGAWAEFKSAIESLKLDIFEQYKDTIKEFLDIMTNGLRDLGSNTAWAVAIGESVKFVISLFGLLTKAFLGLMMTWKNAVMAAKDIVAMVKEYNLEAARAGMEQKEELMKMLNRQLAQATADKSNAAQVQNIKNIRGQITALAADMTRSRTTIEENGRWLKKHNEFMVQGQAAVKEMAGAVEKVDGFFQQLTTAVEAGTQAVLNNKEALEKDKKATAELRAEQERWNNTIRATNELFAQRARWKREYGETPGWQEPKGMGDTDWAELGQGPGANEYNYENLFGSAQDLEDSTKGITEVYETAATSIRDAFVAAFTEIARTGKISMESIGSMFISIGAAMITQAWVVAASMKAALISTGWGIALVAIGGLMSRMGGGGDEGPSAMEELTDAINNLDDSISDWQSELDKEIFMLGENIHSWSETVYDLGLKMIDMEKSISKAIHDWTDDLNIKDWDKDKSTSEFGEWLVGQISGRGGLESSFQSNSELSLIHI